MCLGIPAEVISVLEDELRTARVSFGGAIKEVYLVYTPEAGVGDYVIVHAGFGISRVDPAEARRVFAYLDEIGEIEAAPGGSARSE